MLYNTIYNLRPELLFIVYDYIIEKTWLYDIKCQYLALHAENINSADFCGLFLKNIAACYLKAGYILEMEQEDKEYSTLLPLYVILSKYAIDYLVKISSVQEVWLKIFKALLYNNTGPSYQLYITLIKPLHDDEYMALISIFELKDLIHRYNNELYNNIYDTDVLSADDRFDSIEQDNWQFYSNVQKCSLSCLHNIL